MEKGIAQTEYERLSQTRESFLRRGRESSMLTLPSVLPEESVEAAGSDLPSPYQSMGAHGVNSLVASIALTVLPANEPFYRFMVTPEGEEAIIKEIGQGEKNEDVKAVLSQLELSLSLKERKVLRHIERSKLRPVVGEILKHIIIVGNVCIDYGAKGKRPRTFRLDTYVVERNGNGDVYTIITKEQVLRESLSPEHMAILNATATLETVNKQLSDDFVDVYTVVARNSDDETVDIWQEMNGQVLPDSMDTYLIDESPIQAYWFAPNYGNDYSYSYVDHYVGDLKTLEGLSEALADGAAAAARVVYMVDPAGLTQQDDVACANNGDIIAGRASDVHALQSEKSPDFQVVAAKIGKLEERLARAFLLTEGAVRDAERVTAEEIRIIIQSLQKQLGNVYAVLSEEIQEPLLKRALAEMAEDDPEFEGLPKGVEFVVVTGVDALGRNQELERLQLFTNMLQTIGGQAAVGVIEIDELARRIGASTRVDTAGLIKSKEQQAAEAEAAQRNEIAKRATAPVAGVVGQAIAANQAPPSEQEQPAQ